MPGTRWAYALVEGISVKDKDEQLEKIKRKLEEFVRDNYKIETILSEERLSKWRDFQRAIGINPGKDRLTPENLLRTVLKGKPIPNVNTVVDCANIVCLNNLNPQGAFDLDKIKGNISIRYAKKDEEYLELFKENTYKLDSKEIIYSDEEKVYSRLHRDSEWTKVSKTTKNLLLQYDAISFQDDNELMDRILEFAKLVTAINGGKYSVHIVNP